MLCRGILGLFLAKNSSHFFVRNSPNPPPPCVAFMFVKKIYTCNYYDITATGIDVTCHQIQIGLIAPSSTPPHYFEEIWHLHKI